MPMTPEQRERLNAMVEAMRPEAKDAVSICMKDCTTQHGYGKMMAILSNLKGANARRIFLVACIEEGYPPSTARTVSNLMGF